MWPMKQLQFYFNQHVFAWEQVGNHGNGQGNHGKVRSMGGGGGGAANALACFSSARKAEKKNRIGEVSPLDM